MVAEVVLLATLYSHNLTGRTMANGQTYHPNRPAVALNQVPLGSKVIICSLPPELPKSFLGMHGQRNPNKGWVSKCIRATVTDRIAPRFAKRRVDLSDEVARRLGGRMPQRVVIYP